MKVCVTLLCALALASQITAYPTDDAVTTQTQQYSSQLTYQNLKDQFFQYLAKLYLGGPGGLGSLLGAAGPNPAGSPFNPSGFGAPNAPAIPGAPGLPGVPAVPGAPGAPGAPALPGSPGLPGNPIGSGNPLDLTAQIATFKDSFFKSIADYHYNEAINFLKSIVSFDKGGTFLTDFFNQLFGAKCDLLTFAVSLWTNGSQDIVTKYFPDPVKNIVQGNFVYINNVEYNQFLSYTSGGDKQIRAVTDKSAAESSFKMIPSGFSNNTAVFKFYNDKLKLYINLDPTADSVGDRQLLVTEDANDESSKFTLEPWQTNVTAQQYIINSVLYSEPVKLALGANGDGSRYAYINGQEKPGSSREDARFHFTIQPV